jgi:hypothetical protein
MSAGELPLYLAKTRMFKYVATGLTRICLQVNVVCLASNVFAEIGSEQTFDNFSSTKLVDVESRMK